MISKIYWIYPTRACNLECSYCYQRYFSVEAAPPRNEKDKNLYMTSGTAEEVIRFIENDGPSGQKQVQFFGGEPMLAWDIICLFVKRLGGKIKFSITTNGTLLIREKLQFLKDNNFNFAVSIDGPPGVTRKSRPGSESVPIDLVAEFFPRAQIIMTLSPENIEDAYESTLWFLKKDFVNIAHNITVEKPWACHYVKLHNLTFKKLADLYIQNTMAKRAKRPEENSATGEFSFMFIAYAEKSVRNSAYRGERNICGSNPNLLSIDINGDIYPCQDMVTCDREKNYLLGNIRDGYISPSKIPLSAMKFPDRKACFKCWFFHQCVGGCGPKNLLVCGDRFKPITNGCALYARQVQEGMRALLNTGQLALAREKRIER